MSASGRSVSAYRRVGVSAAGGISSGVASIQSTNREKPGTGQSSSVRIPGSQPFAYTYDIVQPGKRRVGVSAYRRIGVGDFSSCCVVNWQGSPERR